MNTKEGLEAQQAQPSKYRRRRTEADTRCLIRQPNVSPRFDQRCEGTLIRNLIDMVNKNHKISQNIYEEYMDMIKDLEFSSIHDKAKLKEKIKVLEEELRQAQNEARDWRAKAEENIEEIERMTQVIEGKFDVSDESMNRWLRN